jgi:hypothetical protein
VVNTGDPGIGVPKYNGGVFSASAPSNEYLQHNEIADDKLSRAIHTLSHLNGERIDFGYLDVRELGSIYEGLLEYRLVVDDAANGVVHLENDKGDRRNLGAYYTPNYIVQTIVSQTLTPILNAREAEYNRIMDRLVEQDWDLLRQEAVDVLLNIKVCDPAMGSGHFLVGAVDFLTDSIIEIIERRRIAHPDEKPEMNPVLRFLNNIRQGIITDLKEQGLPAPVLTDTQLLMRVVMKRCIYGVDLNALAVELAKLSLWLHTFTSGAPLSFLDHHLRCGNSLLGSAVCDVSETIRKKSPLFGGPFTSLLDATAIMQEVAQLADTTINDVRRSEQLYGQLERDLQPYKTLLDLWASQYFGNVDGRDLIELHSEKAISIVRGTFRQKMDARHRKALETAKTLKKTHSFFHWELEFPEVFIDLARKDWAAEPGFDAVIGNPPYVRQERITPSKPFLSARYEVWDGTADLFLYFYELGLRMLKSDHRLGFITSGTYMNSNSAVAFRKFIRAHTAFETAINFGENQPFIGAEMVYPTIAILRKGAPTKTFQSLFIEDSLSRDKLPEAVAQPTVETLSEILDMEEWRFQAAELTQLFKKVSQNSRLGQLAPFKIRYGLKTGFDEAFIIKTDVRDRIMRLDPKSIDVIKPLFRGRDLRPWIQETSGDYLIFIRRGLILDHYPEIKKHLEQFKDRLTPRPANWVGTWSGRASGSHTWYEHQSMISYETAFEQPKIFWPDISKLPRFSLDLQGNYINNSCYMLADVGTQSYKMLALLQSRVTWFCIKQIAVPLRLRGGLWQHQLFSQFIEKLPIPDLTATQDSSLAEIAEAITSKARARYDLHEITRQRFIEDLGRNGGKLTEKLHTWWMLERSAHFQEQAKKSFNHVIPIEDRHGWDRYMAGQRASHATLTSAIIALETQMNAIVYDAFKLDADERALVEKATKYKYGEV